MLQLLLPPSSFLLPTPLLLSALLLHLPPLAPSCSLPPFASLPTQQLLLLPLSSRRQFSLPPSDELCFESSLLQLLLPPSSFLLPTLLLLSLPVLPLSSSAPPTQR